MAADCLAFYWARFETNQCIHDSLRLPLWRRLLSRSTRPRDAHSSGPASDSCLPCFFWNSSAQALLSSGLNTVCRRSLPRSRPSKSFDFTGHQDLCIRMECDRGKDHAERNRADLLKRKRQLQSCRASEAARIPSTLARQRRHGANPYCTLLELFRGPETQPPLETEVVTNKAVAQDRILRRRAGGLQQIGTSLRRPGKAAAASSASAEQSCDNLYHFLCPVASWHGQDASTILVTKLLSEKGDVAGA